MTREKIYCPTFQWYLSVIIRLANQTEIHN